MTPDTKRLAKIMKALSHENRLGLFLEIAKQQEQNFEDSGCFVSHIASLFKLSAPTISHHLKELANADLITTEKRGKLLVASIDKDTVAFLMDALSVVRGE